jgi:uncharacterized protein
VINPAGLAAIGAGVGVVYGAFGAGASAFATPLLALAGVPPLVAVASPLPATIPAGLAGAWSYRRDGAVATTVAGRAVLVGVPTAVAGALSSSAVPGSVLLAVSALMLFALGIRMSLPASNVAIRPHNGLVMTAAVAGTGFAAGLLANSGGFLLVPVFLLIAGLGGRTATGTSLLVAAAMTAPTLATHWALGHVDWTVAIAFAIGLLPGTLAGARLVRRLPEAPSQRAFGTALLVFAAWYLLRLY